SKSRLPSLGFLSLPISLHKILKRRKIARSSNICDRPKIRDAVLDGCTCHRKYEIYIERLQGRIDASDWVLSLLDFIQHRDAERDPRKADMIVTNSFVSSKHPAAFSQLTRIQQCNAVCYGTSQFQIS